jgi:hypothetical protein
LPRYRQAALCLEETIQEQQRCYEAVEQARRKNRRNDQCPLNEIVGPFDLITLFNILYYFPDEDRTGLLDNMRAMLSPQGVLAVVMNFRSRDTDVGAANLNMVNCSLKGLTGLPDSDEITSLLKRCGFRRIEVHRFMPGNTFYGIVAGNA